jgi:hypothetical protein
MAETRDYSKTPPPPITAFGKPTEKVPWNPYIAGIPSFLFYVLGPYLPLIIGPATAKGLDWSIALEKLLTYSLMFVIGSVSMLRLLRPYRLYPASLQLTERLKELAQDGRFDTLTVRVDPYRGPISATRKGNDLLISQWILDSFPSDMVDYMLVRAALVDYRRIWLCIYPVAVLFGSFAFWHSALELKLMLGCVLVGIGIYLWKLDSGLTINERALAITRNLDAALAVVPYFSVADNQANILAGAFDFDRKLRLVKKASKLGIAAPETT